MLNYDLVQNLNYTYQQEYLEEKKRRKKKKSVHTSKREVRER